MENLANIGKFAGPLIQARGTLMAGDGAQQSAEYAAAQMRYNAGQSEAEGQFAAREKNRQSRLAMSRAVAVAAAGGGAADPSVLNIIGRIESEGKLAAMGELYKGSANARAMRAQADVTEYEGRTKARAARIGATTTLLTSSKSMFDALQSIGSKDVAIPDSKIRETLWSD